MCDMFAEKCLNIGIIDADLIGRKYHRFPNLACMKISAYYKDNGHNVELKMDYDNLDLYDKVFISKVFTDTYIDEGILELDNVEYGGTGFYYDKAEPLPYYIEHHMPDYHLYDEWVNEQISLNPKKEKDYTYYKDYSIGFLTRGCFRKCEFCVNQKYNKVFENSPLKEFYDPSRKKICLLDDNFFGCPNWKNLMQELINTGKKYTFKQGLDERILTEEKCEMLFNSNYDGDITFAFDNITDKDIICKKLEMINKYRRTNNHIKFYVLTGFDRNNKYDYDFWKRDINDLFERIQILMKNKCYPYVMRFNKYEESPFRGIYIMAAAWCNMPAQIKKKSFRESLITASLQTKNPENSAPIKYLKFAEENLHEVVDKYFDIKWTDYK